jgi:hypothetical protein
MTNIGIAMAPDTLYRLAPPLIALQFAAFGWRVNREINLGEDAMRRTSLRVLGITANEYLHRFKRGAGSSE